MFTPVGVADNSLRETAIVGPEIKPYMKSTLLDKRMDRVVLNDPQEELDNDDGAKIIRPHVKLFTDWTIFETNDQRFEN